MEQHCDNAERVVEYPIAQVRGFDEMVCFQPVAIEAVDDVFVGLDQALR